MGFTQKEWRPSGDNVYHKDAQYALGSYKRHDADQKILCHSYQPTDNIDPHMEPKVLCFAHSTLIWQKILWQAWCGCHLLPVAPQTPALKAIQEALKELTANTKAPPYLSAVGRPRILENYTDAARSFIIERTKCKCTGDGNKISCNSGEERACSVGQECSATESFDYGQWEEGCKPSKCKCTGDGNKISCTFGEKRFCASDQECFASEPFPYGQWSKGCRKK